MLSKRAVIYTDDMLNDITEKYHLNDYQYTRTNDRKFVLGCPIFDKNSKLVAIVSFDSADEIKVREEAKEELSQLILYYTQQLYEYLPHLFVPKRGIL